MPEYRVTWVIDVDGGSPQDAALKAYKMQADPETTATVYGVQEMRNGRPCGKLQDIDLFPHEGKGTNQHKNGS